MAEQPLTWKCFEVVIPTEHAPKLAYWLNRELGPLDKFGDRRDSGMTVRFAGATTDGQLHAYVTYTVHGGWASDMWRLNPEPGSQPVKAFEKVVERAGLAVDLTKGRADDVLRLNLEAYGIAVEKKEYPAQSDELWRRCTVFMAELRENDGRAYVAAWYPDDVDDVPPSILRDGICYARSDLEADGWVWLRAFEWFGERERPHGEPTGFWMPLVHDQQSAGRERFTWDERASLPEGGR